MDVSIFKASRVRLMLWIAVPPLLVVGVGLGAYALRCRSQCELKQATVLGNDAIQSEAPLIAFFQETARRTGFAVVSVKVEHRVSAENRGMPVLIAEVNGSGSFEVINQFISNVISEQHLLSERAIKISQSSVDGTMDYRAELTFELLLLNEPKTAGGR